MKQNFIFPKSLWKNPRIRRMAILGFGIFAFGHVIAQPSNDNLCSAHVAVDGHIYNASNIDATPDDSTLFGSCWYDNSVEADVWFKFTTSSAGNYKFTTDLGTFTNDDTQMALYTSSNDSCNGTLTEIGCNDDAPSGFSLLSTIETALPANQTIFIQIDGYNGLTGAFQFEVYQELPPVNDNICNASPLVADSIYNATNTYATAEDSTLIGSCWDDSTVDNDVWFTFTPDSTALYSISTDLQTLSNYDTQMALYSSSDNTCQGTLSQIDCNENHGSSSLAALQDSLTGGQTYFIQVDGNYGDTGRFQIEAQPVIVPSNDNPCEAINLNCGDVVTGTTAFAAADSLPDCANDNYAPGVWYSFTPTENDSVNASLCGSDFDTKLYIFSGSCDNLQCLGYNDDFSDCSYSSTNSEVNFAAQNGQTYYIFVSGYSSHTGNYQLSLNCTPITCVPPTSLTLIDNSDCANHQYNVQVVVNGGSGASYNVYDDQGSNTQNTVQGDTLTFGPYSTDQMVTFTADDAGLGSCSITDSIISSCPPDNDNVCNAATIACGDVVTGYTVSATADSLPDCAGSSYAPGVWYQFTPTENDSVTASLCGSSYDTRLYVFSGTCTNLNCVGSNDDYSGCSNSLNSQLDFAALDGETYYIFVSGYSDHTGQYNLSLECTPVTCFPPSSLSLIPQTDCANNNYSVQLVVNGGSDSSYTVSDDQGSASVEVVPGDTTNFGPYNINTMVHFTAMGTGMGDCSITDSISAACPPDNNLPCNAVQLACNQPVSGNSTLATNSMSTNSGCDAGSLGDNKDVWYSFIADSTHNYMVAGSGFDGVIQVYQGDCNMPDSLTEINCADDLGSSDSLALDSLTPGTYLIRYFAWNGSSSGAYQLSLTCTSNGSSGLETVAGHDVNIYPNPVMDEFRITADSPIQQLSLYDITGKMVRNISVGNASAYTVHTSSLKPGIYLLKYMIDGQVATSKIVKN